MIISRDGGPAFPQKVEKEDGTYVYYGMSLRDWYAGLAMKGLLSSPRSPSVDNPAADITTDLISSLSFKMADAMLREGAKLYENLIEDEQ